MPVAADLKNPMDYRLPSSHPSGLLFLSVSGSHMFGFNSRDSDYDLRGAHIARTKDVLSLPMVGAIQETVEIAEPKGPGSEELVTHEIGKFLMLMVKNGGNLVEQVLSPHLVFTCGLHDELRAIAPRVISKRHLQHYLGFANSQIVLMRRRPDKETKIFLYIFRTLMTGIVAAREGVVESNLNHLVERWDGPDADMIRKVAAWKRASVEESALYHEFSPTVLWRIVRDLEATLKAEIETTALPDSTAPDVIADLNGLLLRIREGIGR